MPHTPSDNQKKTDNEAVFRSLNERAQERLDQTNQIIEDADNGTELISDDMTLQFYCECSDENCHLKIPLSLKTYTQIHQNKQRFIRNRHHFIVLPEHQASEVEQVISKEAGYFIVEKHGTPTKQADTLHKTDVNNV